MPVKSASRGKPAEPEIGPVGKALGLDPGDIITSFEGTLAAIYAPKDFSGQNGPFTIQNCDIELYDLNGKKLDEIEKVRIALFNEELPKEWKSKDIAGASKKNRGALQGITYECKESKGKLYEQFKITQTADIALVGEEEHDARESEDTPPEKAAPAASGSRETTVHRDRPNAPGIEEIIQGSMEVYTQAFKAVKSSMKHTDEQALYASVATIFIQAAMKGAVDIAIHNIMAGAVPANNQSEKTKATAVWSEAVMPASSKYAGQKLIAIPKQAQFDLYKFIMQKKEKTGSVSDFGNLVLQMGADLGHAKDYERELWGDENKPDTGDDIPY